MLVVIYCWFMEMLALGTPDSGQNLKKVQDSNTSSGLRLAGINSPFSGNCYK